MSERLDDFEERITAALERKPEPRIPVDFAERLTLQTASLRLPEPRRAVSYGQAATAVAAAILLLAMFILARWTQPSFLSLGFDLQLVMLVQMLLTGGWLIARRRV